MKDTILVNDKKLDWLIIGEGFEIPSFNFNTETTEVKGRPGAVFKNRQLGTYEFSIPLTIVNEWRDREHDDILDDLVRFFDYGNEPVRLQLKSKDWYWNAYIEGPIELPNKTTQFMDFELKVVLADPYKYDATGNKNTAISDQVSIVNSGNTDTPVIIEARALKSASYLMVAKGDTDFFMVGDDNVNTQIKDYSPSIYSDELRSLSGWNKQTTIDFTDNYTGGKVGGTLLQSSSKESLYLDPTSVSGDGWNGAMYKRSFSKSAQDFTTTVKFIVGQNKKGAVRSAQYIYDTDNRVIASIGYTNPSASQPIGRIIVTLFNQNGDQVKIYDYKNNPSLYSLKDYVVYVRLERKGDTFYIKSWKYHEIPYPLRKISFDNNEKTYVDKGKFYQRPIASVSIYSAKNGNNPVMPIYFLGTYTREYLPKPAGAQDMLIKAGDLITINTLDNSILLNEESILSEKSFGSNFFNVNSGYSELMVYPTKIFDTTVKWQDRYL